MVKSARRGFHGLRWMAAVVLTMAAGLACGLPARAEESGSRPDSAEDWLFSEPAAAEGFAPSYKPLPIPRDSEKSWLFDADATFNTKYVWRGIDRNDDPVLQMAAYFSFQGLSVGAWGNLDLTDENDRSGEFSEGQYAADYTWLWSEVRMSVGAIYYDFPGSNRDSTSEVYVGAGLNMPLSPTLMLFYDFDEADGAYIPLSLSYTIPGAWKPFQDVRMTATIFGSVAYGTSDFNEYYYGVDDNAFTDAQIGLALPMVFTPNFKVTPLIRFTSLLDSDIRDNMDDDDNLVIGVGAEVRF